jgi:hypothetical protein
VVITCPATSLELGGGRGAPVNVIRGLAKEAELVRWFAVIECVARAAAAPTAVQPTAVKVAVSDIVSFRDGGRCVAEKAGGGLFSATLVCDLLPLE